VGLLDAQVRLLLECALFAPLEAHRNEESQLASGRLLMPRLVGALTKQRQLELAHRALEAEQQPVVAQARIVDALGIDEQRSYQAAQSDQMVPVAIVAGQTRRLQAQDRAHRAQRDLGDQQVSQMDRIERELDQLRAENERLTRELRKRNGSRGEREEHVQERRGNRERIERNVRRNREEM